MWSRSNCCCTNAKKGTRTAPKEHVHPQNNRKINKHTVEHRTREAKGETSFLSFNLHQLGREFCFSFDHLIETGIKTKILFCLRKILSADAASHRVLFSSESPCVSFVSGSLVAFLLLCFLCDSNSTCLCFVASIVCPVDYIAHYAHRLIWMEIKKMWIQNGISVFSIKWNWFLN